MTDSTGRAPERVEPSPPMGTYLALGDSLAVGVGATRAAEGGYVGRLAARRGMPVRNLAVSGETSTSFIAGGQLAAAVDAIAASDPPVGLVTLDIGGNDLLRLRWTEPCASALASAGCRELVAQTVREFEVNLREILGAIGDAVRRDAPDATLALLAYPNSFSGADPTYEGVADVALVGEDGRIDCDAESDADRGVNDVIACVGRELGAVIVDAHPPFAGRGLELTHIGAGDIHANDAGYELIAELFDRALAPVQ